MTRTRIRVPVRAVFAAALLALGGCAVMSSGTGGGDIAATKSRAEEPVLFSWQSRDGGISGNIVATLPDATYRGQFVQITHETQRSSLEPLWLGWNEGWSDWPDRDPLWSGPYDFDRFSRFYSGKVMANLRSDAGRNMRCRFELNDPARGMSAGGQGNCQIAPGRTIHAVINRS